MTSIPRLNKPKGEKLDAIPGSVPNPLYLPERAASSRPVQVLHEEVHRIRTGAAGSGARPSGTLFLAEKAVRKQNGK